MRTTAFQAGQATCLTQRGRSHNGFNPSVRRKVNGPQSEPTSGREVERFSIAQLRFRGLGGAGGDTGR